METKHTQRFKKEKKNLFFAFLVVIIVFFASFSILLGVRIVNELKEGKYILHLFVGETNP